MLEPWHGLWHLNVMTQDEPSVCDDNEKKHFLSAQDEVMLFESFTEEYLRGSVMYV